MQRKLVTRISEIFDLPISEEQQEKVYHLISGTTQSVQVAKKVAFGAMKARRHLKGMSKAVAKKSQSKFSKVIPVLAPLATATLSISTTYIIGKRSKMYFVKKRKLLEESKEEVDEVEIESWSETVKMMTGYDTEQVSKVLSNAIEKSKKKLSVATKSAEKYSKKAKKLSKEKYIQAKPVLEKTFDKSKKVVNKTYTKGRSVATSTYEKYISKKTEEEETPISEHDI